MEHNTKRILIVEDEPDMIELLVMHAKVRGYEPLVATSADEAESMLGKDLSLIVLDLRLNAGHGFDVLVKAKTSLITQHIPITIFSAQDDMRSVSVAYELGADRFIGKPASVKEVFSRAS